MKSILEDLYYGKIYPSEQNLSDSPEYRLISKKIHDEMDEWQKKLSDYDYRRLEDLHDKLSEQAVIEREDAFIYGFKLGALLMMEVTQGAEDI